MKQTKNERKRNLLQLMQQTFHCTVVNPPCFHFDHLNATITVQSFTIKHAQLSKSHL